MANLCPAVLYELMVGALGQDDAVACNTMMQFSSVLMTGGGRLKRSQWLHFELSSVSDIALILVSTKHISSPVRSPVLSRFDPVLPL